MAAEQIKKGGEIMFRFIKPIHFAIAAGGVVCLAPAASSAHAADTLNQRFAGPVATAAQIEAEAQAQRIVASPEVVAMRPKLEAILAANPVAGKYPDGQREIGHAVDLWTMTLAMRETQSDVARPLILWHVDNSPHSWFGHTQPGMGAAGDNPDHIYRGAYLDGASTYEVKGRLPKNRPAQFSMEIYRGGTGTMVMLKQSSATPDLGNQVSFISTDDMTIAPDGSFTVIVGPENTTKAANFLKLEPGAMTITVRDVLSDWRQEPTAVEIRRIAGPPAAPPLSEQQLVEKLVAELPGFITFWSHFNDHWLGGIPDNGYVGPSPRAGGWGYIVGGRFSLTDKQAIVITTRDAGAPYTGVQVNDPWMIMPGDARKGTLSLNKAQVAPNPDGSVTYVVSVKDPGVANWINTGGLHQGIVILRWQAVPKGADPKQMISEYRLVNLADVKKTVPAATPRMTAAQRKAQIAQRTADYDLRLGTPVAP
jgi:hypothetical protein